MRSFQLAEAEEEIFEAVRFYHENAGSLAAEFYEEFKRCREEIERFPEFWKLVGGGYRRKLMERFPYAVIYRIADDVILIVALAHTSRRPDYWRTDRNG